MYVTMTSERDAASLQQDLDHLADWEEKWQMKFHPQKCSVPRITRNKSTKIFNYQLHGHTLKSETDSKYLGVMINKLSWNNHIDNICNKANSSIAFLRRNLQISQHHIKTNAYFTLVRPQVEYAAMVWYPYTMENIQKIEDALLDMYARTMPERRVVSPKCFSSWDGAVYYRDEWTSVWCSYISVYMAL